MNLKTRIVAGAAAGAMIGALGLAATPANAAPANPATSVTASETAITASVTGTLKGRAFKGHLSHLSASTIKGVPTLTGSIKGTGLPAAGTLFTTEINSVSAVDPIPVPAPVAPPPIPDVSIPAQPECTILALSISDLRLNLLGLIILIPELQLLAGGVTGPDALLGNVLCNLAGAGGTGSAAVAPPVAG